MTFKKYIFSLVFIFGMIFPAGSTDFFDREHEDQSAGATVVTHQQHQFLSFNQTIPSEGELLISAIPFLLWVYIIPLIANSK